MRLRPGYREIPPPPALRGAVSCLWVRVAEADEPPVRVLPDGCADLIWRAGGEAFVAGPDTGPVLTPAAAGTVFAGVRFVPGAGGPALGRPLETLRDERVPAAALDPRLAARLPGTLELAAALHELTRVAVELVAAGPPDAAVREAAARLAAEPGARVDALAGDLGLSERQLRRRCHAAVGYGPKTLARVLRFHRFLALSDAAGPGADLAGLAWRGRLRRPAAPHARVHAAVRTGAGGPDPHAARRHRDGRATKPRRFRRDRRWQPDPGLDSPATYEKRAVRRRKEPPPWPRPTSTV